jgi:hypothetical protein
MGCTMKQKILCSCLTGKTNINIEGVLNTNLEILKNSYGICWDKLFRMGIRNNEKRKHLFVSTVLGKHIPVNEGKSILTGLLLAAKFYEVAMNIKHPLESELISSFSDSRYYQDLNNSFVKSILEKHIDIEKEAFVIGFAETATALGYSVFRFMGNYAYYIHTTRDLVFGKNPVFFREEHSHAVSHYLYLDNIEGFDKDIPLIFVDDEISTGNTILNCIRNLHGRYPRKEYYVLSILNWMDETHYKKVSILEKELGVTVRFIALIHGKLTDFESVMTRDELIARSLDNFETGCISKDDCKNSMDDVESNRQIEFLNIGNFFEHEKYGEQSYLKGTGRFGVSMDTAKKIEEEVFSAWEKLKDRITGERLLFVGTGEFIYIPMLFSICAKGAFYQSSTRSPIIPIDICNYGVKCGFKFSNPEKITEENYLYNINFEQYDTVIIFFEKKYDDVEMSNLLNILTRKAKKVVIVLLNNI